MIILGTTLVLTTGVMWLIMWGIPQLFGKLSSIKFRIPENWNIFYIILAILALGAIVWFFRSRGTGYAGTVATNVSRWLLWPIAIVAIYFLGVRVIDYVASRPSSTPRMMVATPVVSSIDDLPADIVLQIVADCESGDGNFGSGRQLDDNGAVVVGPTDDIGKWQINLPTHWARAVELKIDLWTQEGNERFARILFAERKLVDWEASRPCWESKLASLINSTDVVVQIVRAGQPVQGTIPQGWQMDYWVNLDQVTPAKPVWRGRDIIQVFTIKVGVEEAEVRFRIYPCSVEAPCLKS